MRYLIRFSYDGSHFNGFQRQKEGKSVQKTLEEALTIINKSCVEIKGAGRTDIGVHANGQCAHFDLTQDIPEERVLVALNSIVRPYIYVKECKKMTNEFHARFSVKRKKYIYKIWLGKYDPQRYDYYLFYNKKIHLDRLKECANILKYGRNFHNFVSGSRENYDMIIEEIQFILKDNELNIVFIGKSFYRYMIRNLIGAMLDINEGKYEIQLLKKMLEDNFDYHLSCAPARGLYLDSVYYE